MGASDLDVHLQVDVGQAGFYPGLAQVSLAGDGTFVARQVFVPAGMEATPSGLIDDVAAIRGRIEPAQAAELLERAAAFPWDRPFPSRPGIPDEAVVVLRFGPHRTLTLWLREAEADPQVGAVLIALRSLVRGSIIL